MTMMPLIAVDWAQIVIFAIIVLFSIAGKFIQDVQQRQRQRPDRPQVPPGHDDVFGNVPDAVDDPPNPNEDRLEKEIEAFLRKATGQAPPPDPPPTPKPTPPEPPRKPRTLAPPPAKLASAFPKRESVEEHVERHMIRGGVGERDSRLAETIERADERIESHLHTVFDHRLGKLGTDTSDTAIREGTDAAAWTGRRSTDNPLARKLFDMMSSPSDVGVAIVLSEIVRRPEERWQDDPRPEQ